MFFIYFLFSAVFSGIRRPATGRYLVLNICTFSCKRNTVHLSWCHVSLLLLLMSFQTFLSILETITFFPAAQLAVSGFFYVVNVHLLALTVKQNTRVPW